MNYRIRPVEPGDAAGIHQMRTMPGVMETTSAIPSERRAHCESYLARLGDSDHQFVAVTQGPDGGEIVIGSAGISTGNGRKRHCAGLGIMVRSDWQKRGVGTALMEKVLDVADHWLGILRMELTVFADNAHAIRLYERYGFVREGVLRMGTLRAGTYCDELIMGRIHIPSQLVSSEEAID